MENREAIVRGRARGGRPAKPGPAEYYVSRKNDGRWGDTTDLEAFRAARELVLMAGEAFPDVTFYVTLDDDRSRGIPILRLEVIANFLDENFQTAIDSIREDN